MLTDVYRVHLGRTTLSYFWMENKLRFHYLDWNHLILFYVGLSFFIDAIDLFTNKEWHVYKCDPKLNGQSVTN